MNTKGGGTDEKRQKEDVLQPKAFDGQDYAVNEMGEGDRILGLTTEYSGWDVYNNEARKVDRELVKDWTASLNFLLLFVSARFDSYAMFSPCTGGNICCSPYRIHH
jgi:hypothetical protein